MLSKDLFCKLLKVRDAMFHKNCQVSMFFEDVFVTGEGSIPDCDAVDSPMDKLTSVLEEAFTDTEGLVRLSLGLEDEVDPDVTEIEGIFADGTVRLIHSYDELYDYFMERTKQDAGNN